MPFQIEFGHRVLVIQDGGGFIVHAEVMGIGVTDEKVIVDTMKKLQDRFNNRIRIASFDKGFWTPNNLKELSDIVPLVCLPKKGKRSKGQVFYVRIKSCLSCYPVGLFFKRLNCYVIFNILDL
ncbi:MAG: hypothetical protein GAS50_03005 [Desulfobacterales bacterium]|jgi:hypothetical protein|nr:hypothetical protein [Desulfobacterales bacterium]